MKELDHRGFDGEALVREGIRSAVVPAIIFFSLVADVVAEADRSTADDKIEDDSVRDEARSPLSWVGLDCAARSNL